MTRDDIVLQALIFYEKNIYDVISDYDQAELNSLILEYQLKTRY